MKDAGHMRRSVLRSALGACGALTLFASLVIPASPGLSEPVGDEPSAPAVSQAEESAEGADSAEPAEPAEPAGDAEAGDGADAAPEADAPEADAPGADSVAPQPRIVIRPGRKTLDVSIYAATGTPDFDAEAGPGKDVGPDDNIIRTNDIVNYEFQIGSSEGGSATVEFQPPRGQEIRNVPGWCKDPANPSQVAKPTPELGAPAFPLDANSWLSLPAQTLTCKVELEKNYAGSLFVPAFQRSEVPNGTVLDPASVTLTLGDDSKTATQPEGLVVSAAPHWDVSKNHIAIGEDQGYVGKVARPCPHDETKTCWHTAHTLLISSGGNGKGSTPLTGTTTLVDELNPQSFYSNLDVPAGFWDDQANVEKYAPRLIKCDASGFLYQMPNPRLGEGYRPRDTAHSVRDSGTLTCNHTVGEDLLIQIDNADWSLYTYPTELPSPVTEIPQNRAYAVSALIRIAIPVDAIRDLGYPAGPEDSANLDYVNRYRDFTATGLDGTKQVEGDEEWNNYRTGVVTVRPPRPGMGKYWAGIGKDPLNTPADQYTPNDPYLVGPPGSTVVFGGDIPASGGQVVLSSLNFSGSNLSNPQKISGLLCDTWDNEKAQLQDGNYPAGRTYGMQQYGSDGKAVWIGGRLNFPKDYPFNLEVEYSGNAHSGPGTPTEDESLCRTGDWYSDPAQVPGNDPEALAQGRYTAVNAVRIHAKLPKPKPDADWMIREHYNIALRVVEGQEPKTIIPNWSGYSWGYGDEFIDAPTLLAGGDGIRVIPTNYGPEQHTGTPGRGDRLIFAPAYARIDKTVQLKGGTEFSNLVSATAGDEVEWRLKPYVSSAAPRSGTAHPVRVEDCLPSNFIYETASRTPSLIQRGSAPADSELTCDGGTYIRWEFDTMPNAAIDPIIVSTKVSALAPSDTYTNTSVIQTTPADPSRLASRTSSAQVDVTAASGVRLEKNPITPLTQVNATGNPSLEKNVWELALVNLDTKKSVADVDVIDALPVATGLHGSQFSGTMTFVEASVLEGDGVQLLYAGGTIATNPRDDANGPTGTAWCDAPGGTVVLGQGTCPATAADVTGLRLLKSTDLAPGEAVRASVTMVPEGNATGDVYINRAEGSVAGLEFTVGPADAAETVIGSSIGDFVWNDENNNGIQDAGETGVADHLVSLSGTDDLGNPVTREVRTDAQGHYTFGDLREGTYTVTFDPTVADHRELALQGAGPDRALDSDGDPVTGVTAPIALDRATDRTDIDQGIAYKVGALRFVKVSPTGVSLEGSEWTLTPAGPLTEGRPVRTITDCVAAPCTGADTDPAPGAFLVEDLRWGAWDLVETTPPAGYQLDATPHRVTIGADGVADVDLGDIVNEPYSFDLPHTGGVAALVFLGIGGGLLAFAVLAHIVGRKRA